MRKFLWNIIIPLLSLFSVLHCSSQNNGLLFEIRGNGLKKSSYIFGSFPLSNKYKYNLDNSVLKYIDACDKVTTELDFVKGVLELTDSQGISDYSFRLLSKLYNGYVNEVYIPAFATSDEAEKSLFTLISTGGSSITQLENMYASKLGLKSDLDKWQWPNFKVMQYAVKKNKAYSGLQSIDSMLFDYLDFIKTHENIPQQIAKSLKDIPVEQQKSIMELIPSYIAGGKATELYSLLKHLKYGNDTLVLQIINLRTNYIASKLNRMMQEQSVFSAVNWLTLTNPNGILQTLRNMGYTVKPVKMKSQAETTFNNIKALPYECTFKPVKSNDGFLEFIFPGQARTIQAGPYINTWVYYDVVNKSAFTVARIKHNYTFKGKSRDYILKKTDSLLYEKVPGTIEKKEIIENEFYTGYEITSVNRKDNYMRFRFYVTPYEFVLVKCEGEKRYAIQPVTDQFFENFRLNTELLKTPTKEINLNTVFYTAQAPAIVSGFYRPDFYHSFLESYDAKKNIDMIYSKGTYHSNEYLDEDTFLLNTCIRNFTDNLNLKERNRSYAVNQITATFQDDKSRYYTVSALRYGIYYYIIAASHPDSSGISVKTYFDGFKPVNNITYPSFISYTDTALHYTVTTPYIAWEEPHSRMANMLERFKDISKKYKIEKTELKHTFTSFNSGETIKVDFAKYDEYSYFPDSLAFWNTILDNAGVNYEFKISRKKTEYKNGIPRISFLLTDTNTSLGIKIMAVIKGKVLFIISAGMDTSFEESRFVSTFFNTFEPTPDTLFGSSVFQQQTEKYLDALISSDSATVAKALKVFPLYSFEKKHIEKLGFMLKHIPPKNDETEVQLIKDRIMDIFGSVKEDIATDYLKQWYYEAGDTSEIQMRILSTMARQKTKYALNTLKNLLVENPPAAKNSSQSGFLFSIMEESAQLSGTLIPELLPLLSNEDFKDDFLDFIAYLTDSNYIDPKIYDQHVTELILLAKNELKRQNSKETEDDRSSSSNIVLVNYTKMLIPFYNSNAEVKYFIDKCLLSNDLNLRQDIACTMLKHNISVADSIWVSLAKNDFQRTSLFNDLSLLNHTEKMPVIYRTQEAYARAIACNELIYDIGKDKYKASDLIYIKKRKVYFHQQWGYVYLFKIRSNRYDNESTDNKEDWKLIMSGLQPIDTTKANLNYNLTFSSTETLNETKSIDEQFDDLLYSVINSRRHNKYLPLRNTNESSTGDYTKYYED